MESTQYYNKIDGDEIKNHYEKRVKKLLILHHSTRDKKEKLKIEARLHEISLFRNVFTYSMDS